MYSNMHKYFGFSAYIIIIILSISGSVLSVFPAWDRLTLPTSNASVLSVAQVAQRIQQEYPTVEQIKRLASGKVIIYYFENEQPVAEQIDPLTAAKIAPYEAVGFKSWVTKLHRSLFLDDSGRILAAFAALSMLILSISGAKLVAKRNGGWRKFFNKAQGNGSQKLHVQFGQFALVGFLISSITAIYMFLVTFGFVQDGLNQVAQFPQNINVTSQIQLINSKALKQINLDDLRELTFPYPDDTTDVFAISTNSGAGYVDPSTGEMLGFVPYNLARQIYEFIYMLHTGRGIWWLGLMLGLTTGCIPVLSVTGLLLWWRKRKDRPKIRNISSAQKADKIILVGSQDNSSWAFAKALHDGLVEQNFKVHICEMNKIANHYKNADTMFILASTYDDGEAPKSANKFLQKLDVISGIASFKYAVLGFGDKQFPKYCKFAINVEQKLNEKAWQQLMQMERINQQSAQAFEQWGQKVAVELNVPLEMDYKPKPRATQKLALVSRQDFGQKVQAPTSILRFGPGNAKKLSIIAKLFNLRLPKFEAGDLVGIIPQNSDTPRFYSLASSNRDGFLEICVRKQAGGLCSGQLHGLEIGDEIDVFIQPNPKFKPDLDDAPVILIGAGAGIAPLTGFLRQNIRQQPMHLYFGCRDPQSDFLYESEIDDWLKAKKLETSHIAFSRIEQKTYVQDCLTEDVESLRSLMRQGAQIMICGSKNMANEVEVAMKFILKPMGISIEDMRNSGRYLEDVY